MIRKSRVAWLAFLLAAFLIRTEAPVEAEFLCSDGYVLSSHNYANCYPTWGTFCFEMDMECWAECYPESYQGICWDLSNPCDYACCCRIPG